METKVHRSLSQWVYVFLQMFLGSLLAVVALEIFLLPNQIIDGGVVGVATLLSRFLGPQWLYPAVFFLNIPFIILAIKHLGSRFVVQMAVAVALFTSTGLFLGHGYIPPYRGELLEIVVVGGILLGLGVGLIIRSGACVDGTEILGILCNRRWGYTVGSVVMGINIMIFLFMGAWFHQWQEAIQSLITFFIVVRTMDFIILGLDEMRAVWILPSNPEAVAQALMHELKMGLTIIKGEGGYTGQERQIFYLIVERLQIAPLKEIVSQNDEHAVIAIESIHELVSGSRVSVTRKIPGTDLLKDF